MKITINGPKGFDPHKPFRNGVNVVVIDRSPDEVVITAKRAKSKAMLLTAAQKTHRREMLRRAGMFRAKGSGESTVRVVTRATQSNRIHRRRKAG